VTVYLLDTDTLSLVFRGGEEGYPLLKRRLEETPPETRFVCAVTVEEMLAGALAKIRLEETKHQGTSGYALLVRLVRFLSTFPILPFNDEANALYQAMPAAIKRQGRGDCKIAAVALRHGCTMVTRNVSHFSAIPGVACEDWTV
jgi:tRNA(fMet)-specific endonuclease VapC